MANSELQMMLNDENTDEIADKIFKLYERLAYRLIVTMDDLPKDSMPFEWYIKSTEHISEDGSSKNTPLDDSGMRFVHVCRKMHQEDKTGFLSNNYVQISMRT